MRTVFSVEGVPDETADGIHQAGEEQYSNIQGSMNEEIFLPCREYEDQLPHLPTLHVVKIYKEKDEPHTSGDVALQHDHREQQASEHGTYTGCAQDPEAT